MPETRFIAIDSGGTHTRGLACTKEGAVLKRYSGRGANPKDIGWKAAFAIYSDCFNHLLEGHMLERACITAAGIGDTPKHVWANELSVDLEALIIMGDAHAAHLGAFSGGDGIMVIAGTGMSMLGRKGDELLRLGGWGHILGDQGSGYGIGLAGLRSVIWSNDIGEETALVDAAKKTYGFSDNRALLEHVHSSAKAEVAKFAKAILQLATTGSEQSVHIVRANVESLAPLLKRFLELGFPSALSYSGGLFQHPYYFELFKEMAKRTGLELHAPKLTPLEAAMQVALGHIAPLANA